MAAPSLKQHADPEPESASARCSVHVCGDAAAFIATTPGHSAFFCSACAARAQAIAIVLGIDITVHELPA